MIYFDKSKNLLEEDKYHYELQDVESPELFRDLYPYEEIPKVVFNFRHVPMDMPAEIWMTDTTFPWTLNYDEMDYVIEGRLDIQTDRGTVSAGPGEIIYIPRGSAIRFSVTGHARFLYFVYPADWQSRNA